MCNESMSSYWYHVVPADVHSPLAPHPFSPPFQPTKTQSRTGRGNNSQEDIQVAQMEHTEVLWLGQTLSAMTGLGGLLLPPSVDTS